MLHDSLRLQTSRDKLSSLAAVLLPASLGLVLLNWIIIGLLSAIMLSVKIDNMPMPTKAAGLSSKPLAMEETLVRNPSMPSRLNAEVEIVILP